MKHVHMQFALTGHRPHRLGGYNTLAPQYQKLDALLEETVLYEMRSVESPDWCNDTIPYVTLHSGMALGADTIWSGVAMRLRQRFPNNVRFVAHVPFPQQPNKWRSEDQKFWQAGIAMADEVVTYGNRYSAQLLFARNVGMINRAENLIAVYDGTPTGGTHHAVEYARSQGKNIKIITPASLGV